MGALLGRRLEWAAIERVLASPASGRASAAVLRGDAGLGKSALLREAAGVARARQWTVLATRGQPADQDGTFAGLAELLEPISHDVSRLPDPARSVMTAALGRSAAVIEPHAVRRSMVAALAVASERRPILLVVDDAQWLDRASLEAVLTSVQRLDAEPVATLFACRRGNTDPLHGCGLDEITIRSLSDEVLAELVDNDAPIAAEVRDHCVHLAGGNPLAALEFSRALTPAQRRGEEPFPVVPDASSAAERACAGRLAAVSERARRALMVVAADTTGLVRAVSGALAELGEGSGGLDEAEQAGLVALEGPRVDFAHPLLRSLAYYGVAPASRRAAHRALAVALDQPHDAESRAWHLGAGAVGPDRAAAEALELVARRAAARGAPAVAALAAQRAAATSDDADLRRRCLQLAAEGWLHAGDPVRAGRVADDLIESFVDGEALALAAIALRWRDGPRLTARRVRDLGPAGRAAAARELRAAGELGAADTIEVAAPPRGPWGEALAALDAADLRVRQGLDDDAARVLDEVGGWCGPALAGDVAALRGRLLLRSGDTLGALGVAEEGLRQAPAVLTATASATVLAARCEVVLGMTETVPRRLGQVIDTASELGLGSVLVDAHEVLALLASVEGRFDDAVHELQRAVRAMAAWAWPADVGDARCDLVEALAHAGRSTEAKSAAAALRPGSNRWSAGRSDRAIGIATGDHDALRRAVELLQPYPFEQALALVALGDHERAGSRFAAVGARRWIDLDAGSFGTADPLSALSAAELRVALEVGRGRTNRAAADALFLSVKTVDFHLQSIYRKLTINSRAELAALVGRRKVADQEVR